MKTIDHYIVSELTGVPEINVGDEILFGKWKNKRAKVQGIKFNDKGQPVLKTDKGDVNLFHFRLAKMIPEEKTAVKESLDVTPIIKKKRVQVEEFDVCPHCQQEIMEKSMFGEDIDGTYYMYHRPCMDKGPIQKITREDSEKALKELLGG